MKKFTREQIEKMLNGDSFEEIIENIIGVISDEKMGVGHLHMQDIDVIKCALDLAVTQGEKTPLSKMEEFERQSFLEMLALQSKLKTTLDEKKPFDVFTMLDVVIMVSTVEAMNNLTLEVFKESDKKMSKNDKDMFLLAKETEMKLVRMAIQGL